KPVRLEGGKAYYIEALHKEGGGDDHPAVGWRLPDGKDERPIPLSRLMGIKVPSGWVRGGIPKPPSGDSSGGPSLPALPPASGEWEAIFDGRTLDCLVGGGNNAWRVENGAIVHVPGTNNAAQTRRKFGDGEVRIVFEPDDRGFFFAVRQGDQGDWGIFFDKSRCGELKGKVHELIFSCSGSRVEARLNGQPVELKKNGNSREGSLQFNCAGTALIVRGIYYRPFKGPTGGAADPKSAPSTGRTAER
ncbi:MAG: DUF1080 domain-containing protein, partial [Planctomycetota bacterium]|nr:DUF1080 domain-containing protein [Planctomycetota bacterium]